MTVLFTVASLDPADGGVPECVQSTCSHLAGCGVNVEIVTGRSHPEASVLKPSHDNVNTTYATARSKTARLWTFWRTLSARIDRVQPDIIHDNGLWLPTNILSALAARRAGIPHVVTSHGMLEPWAVQHRGWKKKAAWYGYQRAILERADVLHATAPMEAQNLRDLGLWGPIAVIPNGVPLPDTWKQEPSSGERRQALFLSRIHPKKGLPNLIEAWSQVQPDGWDLIIAGPDENDHRWEVVAAVKEHGLGDVVSFPGPVRGEDKWALYRESDLFVLPTHSENFGVVVAEALASGIPALTTTGAPWSILEEEDCGWWVETTVEALETALSDAASRSDSERLAMGQRGRALVEEQFSWEHVAAELRAVYEWILGDVPRPDCVRFDD
ncbi:glycosyltransferase involved in cell wall biosynthesis [Salinibacter ruber]|uniref:glycosyltransferase n=1 Tax=Salinibacter ruber TaxID=146919 RepID=UPI0021689F56|nr:glycosyltransferase [Salinibacter ruber]MCS3668082.1 glycosyltransferase involved in cell wall biosynthesis [Salinibacter ruber]